LSMALRQRGARMRRSPSSSPPAKHLLCSRSLGVSYTTTPRTTSEVS
jgi:hypothetical protein